MSTPNAPRSGHGIPPGDTAAPALRYLEFLLGAIGTEARELLDGRPAADVERLRAWVATFIAQDLPHSTTQGTSGPIAALAKLRDMGRHPPADGPLRKPRTRFWEFGAAFAMVGAAAAAELAREANPDQAELDQLLYSIITALSIATWEKATESQVKRDAVFLREGNRTYQAEKTQRARDLSRKRWHQRDADRVAALTFAAALTVPSRIEAARRTADMLQERQQADYTVETVDAWLKTAKWKPHE